MTHLLLEAAMSLAAHSLHSRDHEAEKALPPGYGGQETTSELAVTPGRSRCYVTMSQSDLKMYLPNVDFSKQLKL